MAKLFKPKQPTNFFDNYARAESNVFGNAPDLSFLIQGNAKPAKQTTRQSAPQAPNNAAQMRQDWNDTRVGVQRTAEGAKHFYYAKAKPFYEKKVAPKIAEAEKKFKEWRAKKK